MLGWLFAILLTFSLVAAVCGGNAAALAAGLVSGATDAAQLFLTLLAMMMFWNGFMQVARDCGLLRRFARLLAPLVKRVFPEARQSARLCDNIAGNFTANFFGIGNAATPLGLAAMQELKRTAPQGTATRSMMLLVLINTASIQFMPSNIASLRAAAGSLSPFDIMPAVWGTSVAALAAGLAVFFLLTPRRGDAC